MNAINEEKSVGKGAADTVAFCAVSGNVLLSVVSTELFTSVRRG